MKRRRTRWGRHATALEKYAEFLKQRDSLALRPLIARYLEWLTVRNFASRTIEVKEQSLSRFADWCEARGLEYPERMACGQLESYQRHLFYHRRPQTARTLSFQSQQRHLVAVRTFFGWLARQRLIPADPSAGLELPRVPKKLPRASLTAAEAEAVLALPDVRVPAGLRDRAILEVLYSTGIRRGELLGLSVYDVDFGRGLLLIRRGKGGRDRYVPVGERALLWLGRYLTDVRPTFAPRPDPGVLFVSQWSDGFTPKHIGDIVRRYLARAVPDKPGSCHLFRHTFATLLLEAGVDIRYIQALLGHADLSSTQVYTQVALAKLKELHTRLHPARLPAQPSTNDRQASEEAGGGLQDQ
jgi:integrase/recombinase XerD